MNRADVLDLYRYDEWANERIAAALIELPNEAYTRRLGGSYPTIADAFAHIVATEWVWLERWNGTSPTSPPDWLGARDAAVIVGRMRDVNGRRAEFLNRLTDADLASSVSFTFLSGAAGEHRLADLLLHVTNHSTYHRGQIASMLRQLETVPPSTDFILYRSETRTQI